MLYTYIHIRQVLVSVLGLHWWTIQTPNACLPEAHALPSVLGKVVRAWTECALFLFLVFYIWPLNQDRFYYSNHVYPYFFFFCLLIISVSKRGMLKFPAVFVDVSLLFVITTLGGTSFWKTRKLIPKLRNVFSRKDCKEWTQDSNLVVSITTVLITWLLLFCFVSHLHLPTTHQSLLHLWERPPPRLTEFLISFQPPGQQWMSPGLAIIASWAT